MFKVGDRVMIIYPDIPKYHCAIGMITADYKERLCRSGDKLFGWIVDIDGEHFQATARILRKIEDDPEHPRQLGRWADCPWQPKGVRS